MKFNFNLFLPYGSTRFSNILFDGYPTLFISGLTKIYNLMSRVFFVLIAMIICNTSMAQNITPSTNAMASSEVGKGTSVDYATGVMTYRIPLMKKSDGDGPEINLGISYSAKGIKTEQNPSVVGLGWALTGTGAVYRSIRGLVDDSPWGGSVYQPIPTDPSLLPDFKNKVNNGERDGESDIFTLNYAEGGLNVQFILETIPVEQGMPIKIKAVPLEKTDVKINIIQSDITGEISGFHVTNTQGDVFKFMEIEELGAYVQPGGGGLSYTARQAPNAWYLTEIISHIGEAVRFEYLPDVSSESRSLTGQTAIVYGQTWKELGKAPLITEKINNRIKQLNLDVQARYALEQQMATLQASIENEERSLKMMGYGPSIVPLSDAEVVELASKFNNSSVAQMNVYAIARYDAEIQRLIKSIPERNYTVYSDPIIQNLLVQLYQTYSFRETSASSLPTLIFTQVKLLKRILLRNSTINFNYETSMRGLFDRQLKTFLKEITVGYGTSTIASTVKFEYSPEILGFSNPFLKAVQIKGSDPSDLEGRYTFEYFNEDQIVRAEQKDFWGFYNGEPTLEEYSGLIPSELSYASRPLSPVAELLSSSPNFSYVRSSELTFNSRTPVPEKTVHWSLKSVKLPEGGEHEFEYENNTVSGPRAIVLAGGLRIKKITAHDGLGHQYVKRYKYEFISPGGGTSSGNMESMGFYVKRGYQSMTLKVDYPNSFPSDIVISSDPYDFSGQLQSAGNEDVFYSYVEESTEGLGRTGYRYLKFSPSGRDYPFWLERLLLAKADYDENGRLKRVERFKYQADENDVTPFIGLVSEGYYSRFFFASPYRFNGLRTQYRAFPYKALPYSMDMYPPITFGTTTFSFEDLYLYNMAPRLAITNLPTEYVFRTGGQVVLKEKETWSSEQRLTEGGEAIPNGPNFAAYDVNWLFTNNYGSGSWNKEILHYDNPSHTYATRVEIIGAGGERNLVKTKYVADYNNGVASFIDAQQSSNRLKDVIEQQRWVFSPAESLWRLASGKLQDFVSVNSMTDGAVNVNCILPANTYETELDQALLPGSPGWSEEMSSSPPYQTLFHEGHNVYKLSTQTSWKAYRWGMQKSGVTTHNGLVKQSFASDYYSNLVVKGASGAEIFKLPDYGGISIRKPAVYPNINFSSNAYDNIGYIKDLRARLMQVRDEGYGIYDDPVYMLTNNITLVLEKFLSYETFLDIKSRFVAAINAVPAANIPGYDQDFSPYLTFQELKNFSQALQSYTINEASYRQFFGNRTYIVAPNGQFEIRMSLSAYQQNHKRLQFTSLNDFSCNYKVVYNGGAEQNLSTHNTETKNDIRRGFLDLNDLPNSAAATELVFTFSSQTSNQQFFIIPEGCEFKMSSYNDNGLLVKVIDDKGEAVNYYYDTRDRLSYETNKKGEVTRSYKYNQATATN